MQIVPLPLDSLPIDIINVILWLSFLIVNPFYCRLLARSALLCVFNLRRIFFSSGYSRQLDRYLLTSIDRLRTRVSFIQSKGRYF